MRASGAVRHISKRLDKPLGRHASQQRRPPLCAGGICCGRQRRSIAVIGALLASLTMGAAAEAGPRLSGPQAIAEAASPTPDPGPSSAAGVDGWRAGDEPGGGAASPATNIDKILNDAQEAYARADFEIAQRLFERLIALAPASPAATAARRRLGAIYRGESGTAERQSRQAASAGASSFAPIAAPPLKSAQEAETGGRTVARATLPDLPAAEPPQLTVKPAGADLNGPSEPPVSPSAKAQESPAPQSRTAPAAQHEPALQAWRPRARISNRFESLLRADVGDRVFFGVTSASIGTRARNVLERQAEWVKRYPDLYVVVEGHADEPGDELANDEIARQRAETARSILVTAGVPADHVDIEVRGSKDRVVLCEGSDCRSQNRRAVIRLMVVLPSEGERSSGRDDGNRPRSGVSDISTGKQLGKLFSQR